MSARPRFHLAFPVHDLVEARAFYGSLLGCREGRSADDWVDFDFFGHQIVTHLSPAAAAHKAHNWVDDEAVPVRHFGVIPNLHEREASAARPAKSGAKFAMNPHKRFVGQPGEQATLYVGASSGNIPEFKAFAGDAMVFAR
jgi:extradiol dioxygenase family protein